VAHQVAVRHDKGFERRVDGVEINIGVERSALRLLERLVEDAGGQKLHRAGVIEL
jgi:hypothetical protein